MPILTQSRFPRLWLFMQHTIGGTPSKQAMATEHYQGQKRVLEIGCSVGNISSAFGKFPDIAFTGIDIDRAAIKVAQKRFRNYTHFDFAVTSLGELAQLEQKFDYILFAGILHHVTDDDAVQLLRDAIKCCAEDGLLVISEPEAVKPFDNKFMKFFYATFEQGGFLRSRQELVALVARAGLRILSAVDRMQSLGITKRPITARFTLISGKPH